MKLSECINLLEAEIFEQINDMDIDIKVACGADLMSDVMAFACSSNEMMLTGLVNPQTIRTAEMMDIKVIVFVRGKKPDDMMREIAKSKNICLISTKYPMFTSCGKLYNAGILGKGEN